MNVKPPRADLNPGSAQSNRVAGATPGAGSSPVQKTAGVSGDTVTFTSTAAEMLKLEESLAKLPDIDNARVVSIKASIDQGTYRIDPEKIVDGLLKIEQDLR